MNCAMHKHFSLLWPGRCGPTGRDLARPPAIRLALTQEQKLSHGMRIDPVARHLREEIVRRGEPVKSLCVAKL